MDYIKEFREKFGDKDICCGGDLHKGIDHLDIEDIEQFITKVANDTEAKTLYDCWNEMGVLLSEGESVETVLKRWHTRIESARNTQV